jgi:hypothetical protein
MRDIYRLHGLRGLYFGGLITSLRDSIGYGFYFWGYEGSKLLLLDANDSDPVRMGKMLTAGGIAGCITWASVYPLGIITCCYIFSDLRYCQDQISNTAYGVIRGDETFDCKRTKISLNVALHKGHFSTRGGIGNVQRDGRYHGQGFCWYTFLVRRLSVVNAVTFYGYEWVKEWLDRK